MNLLNDLRELTININALVRNISLEHKITLAQSNILASIPFKGIPVASLSHKVGVDISTMSRNIDKLTQQNLIYKERDVSDARIFNLFLTESGFELLQTINDRLSSLMVNIIPDIETTDSASQSIEKLNWLFYKYRNV